tara:strand:- start:123 stop:854 length:732 start_codon:yes stop_codon:yes gene_type:complete
MNYQQKATQSSPAIDEALRTYMLRVYNYMAAGLAITGVVSYILLQLTAVIGENGELIGLTQLGATMYGGNMLYVFALSPVIVLWFGFSPNMSASRAQTTFWILSVLMAFSLAPLFIIFTGSSVVRVFLITSSLFGLLSLYGYTTKKDLTGFGSFLAVGVIGLFLVSIVNLFIQSSTMMYLICYIGVPLMLGCIAYRTQHIKNQFNAFDSEESMKRNAIIGALDLYIFFINLFKFLIIILGNRR